MSSLYRLTRYASACGAIVLIFVLMVAATEAQWWDEGGTYHNFDATNDTGHTANDFEVTLGGVSVGDVSDYYTDDYGNVTENQAGGDVKIHWSTDGQTASGETEHFGFALTKGTDYSSMDMQWTWNGLPVGGGVSPNNYPPDVSPRWEPHVDLDMLRSLIHNNCPTMSSVWIQRRVNTSTGAMTVDELLVGGNLWNTATLIDASPIVVPFCNTVTYDFDWDAGTPNYVMMYEVWEDNGGLAGGPGAAGDLEVVHLTAARAIPEPASIALILAAASFGLLAYALRRTRAAA